jgi:tetratricopeptide (TPR) repeat protein
MLSTLVSAFAGLVLVATSGGPSDEMFEALRRAPEGPTAEQLEADVSAALRESGSATADILLERAMVAQTMQDFDLSREFLDRAIAVEPDFAEAWFQRAMLFIVDEAYDQAILDLNEALTHEPRHFNAWLMLGNVFEQLGQNREAVEAYREVLAIHPNHERARAQVRRLEPLVFGRAI